MISSFALTLLLPLVSAYTLGLRDTVTCDQYGTLEAGSYSLLADQWGLSNTTTGSQCVALESVNGDTVAWYTNWEWSGGNGIKSFANVQLNNGINQVLSAVNSMPSEWNWSQSNTGTVIADVAYDLFTAYSPGGKQVNEIMIWLANFNSGAISYNYDSSGNAIPVTTNILIAGYEWDLYHGNNGNNEVYSFLPVQGDIGTFNADILGFLTYLIDNAYFQSSEYLVTAQAGTEATSGQAVFTTSSYNLAIN